ncbi:MAG: RHS repeat-associated core domain-containing protein [Verrucomicrobiota bacterium]
MAAVYTDGTFTRTNLTYTRGLDLSGSSQGAGGIGGLLAKTDNSLMRRMGSSALQASACYHADGNGNITMLVDALQNVVARYQYDPYGNTLFINGSLADANTYRSSSKEFHVLSGKYYYGFRYYSPSLQRWMNADPIGELGGINLYAFGRNNPVSFCDPFGLDNQYNMGAGNNAPPALTLTFTPITIPAPPSLSVPGTPIPLPLPPTETGQFVMQVESNGGDPLVKMAIEAGKIYLAVAAAELAGAGAVKTFDRLLCVRGGAAAEGTTGYRLVSSDAPYLKQLLETGTIPANPRGTYFSYDNLGDALGSFRAQIPHDGNIMIEFDATQLGSNIKVPLGNYGQGRHLEPIARDFPDFGFGGSCQRMTTSPIQATRIIDRRTGAILYGK